MAYSEAKIKKIEVCRCVNYNIYQAFQRQRASGVNVNSKCEKKRAKKQICENCTRNNKKTKNRTYMYDKLYKSQTIYTRIKNIIRRVPIKNFSWIIVNPILKLVNIKLI